MSYLWVALGGAIGATSRFALIGFFRNWIQSNNLTIKASRLSHSLQDNLLANTQTVVDSAFHFFLLKSQSSGNQASAVIFRWLAAPYVATMFVNFVGAFIAGAVYWRLPESNIRLFFVTGFLGGLTTMSAFNTELLELIISHKHFQAMAYLIMTALGGTLLSFFGFAFARSLKSIFSIF